MPGSLPTGLAQTSALLYSSATGARPLAKAERQRLIASIVTRKRIGTQLELAEALAEAGCQVTQATVSRDIRELGLEKTSDQLGRPALRRARPRLAARDPRESLNAVLEQFGVRATRGAEHRRRPVGARLGARDRPRARPARAPADRRHARRRRHLPRDHRRPRRGEGRRARVRGCNRLGRSISSVAGGSWYVVEPLEGVRPSIVSATRPSTISPTTSDGT